MRFEDLPDGTDLAALSAAVRDIVREMQKAKRKTHSSPFPSSIADLHTALPGPANAKPSLNAIKLFVHKHGSLRVNYNNTALPTLFNFIQENLEQFPDEIQAVAICALFSV